MSLIAKKTGTTFEPVKEGPHIGVCSSVIDLGHHHNPTYNKMQHKVLIVWELMDETITIEGKEVNRSINKIYTNTLSENGTLRKDLEAWRGKKFTEKELNGFDLSKLLGTACQLMIVHNDNGGSTYANISGIMALPKNYPIPELPKEQLLLFDIDSETVLDDLLKLPEWVQKKVKESEEFKARSGDDGFEEMGSDDDLPF